MNIENRLHLAVQSFWDSRDRNLANQKERGKIDAGTRGAVTAGTQMGALEALIADILCEAGLRQLDVKARTGLELPGFYRPEKRWDLIVVSEGQLVLAMEFKSMVGSFGKNANNRFEEAIGSAKDIWTAFREGRFGDSPTPFLGYFFLLEDREEVHEPKSNVESCFPVDFQDWRRSRSTEQVGCLVRQALRDPLSSAGFGATLHRHLLGALHK